jgi:hypothetical protein
MRPSLPGPQARERAPHIRFELLDALQSPESLAALAAEVAADIVFVDIGGNRQASRQGAGGSPREDALRPCLDPRQAGIRASCRFAHSQRHRQVPTQHTAPSP